MIKIYVRIRILIKYIVNFKFYFVILFIFSLFVIIQNFIHFIMLIFFFLKIDIQLISFKCKKAKKKIKLDVNYFFVYFLYC